MKYKLESLKEVDFLEKLNETDSLQLDQEKEHSSKIINERKYI